MTPPCGPKRPSGWSACRRCAGIIGATRPDGTSAIDETLDILGPKAREKIHLMEVPEMKLSATYLRERLRSGKTVRYMLPKCVVEYIEENHIYGKE